MRALWNGFIIAHSDRTVVVEGNHYFPPGSIDRQYLQPSDHHTTCPWKGTASYYHVKVGDDLNPNAAWYYPDPSGAAAEIKDHVAFWKGVEVVE